MNRKPNPYVEKARLDPEGTAKGKTRIVHHPNEGDCVGPGTSLKNPEYEGADHARVSLTPSWSELPCGIKGYDMTALAYGKLIAETIDNGNFVLAAHYLDLLMKSGHITRIQMAWREYKGVANG